MEEPFRLEFVRTRVLLFIVCHRPEMFHHFENFCVKVVCFPSVSNHDDAWGLVSQRLLLLVNQYMIQAFRDEIAFIDVICCRCVWDA
jgi:hypothetical protein